MGYLEVIDYDPTVDKFYSPVDLNDSYILAQDGLDPSGSNPQLYASIIPFRTFISISCGLSNKVTEEQCFF